MLSREDRIRLPTFVEREACKSGQGELCHGITEEIAISDSWDSKSPKELDQIRKNIDWVSGHCHTVQCATRQDKKDLPCNKLRTTIFRFKT